MLRACPRKSDFKKTRTAEWNFYWVKNTWMIKLLRLRNLCQLKMTSLHPQEPCLTGQKQCLFPQQRGFGTSVRFQTQFEFLGNGICRTLPLPSAFPQQGFLGGSPQLKLSLLHTKIQVACFNRKRIYCFIQIFQTLLPPPKSLKKDNYVKQYLDTCKSNSQDLCQFGHIFYFWCQFHWALCCQYKVICTVCFFPLHFILPDNKITVIFLFRSDKQIFLIWE